MNYIKYPGNELELFSQAINWKRYWASKVSPYIGHSVLEVGAGTGSNTNLLCPYQHQRWVCLEPDKQLANDLSIYLSKHTHTSNCEIIHGTIKDLSQNDLFDTILYIDVLEHIINDKTELEDAKNHLKPKGILIILAPAHKWLFSNFDKSIGHYRRYNKHMLNKIIPSCFEALKMEYLDSIGIFASLYNSLILKESNPTQKQIKIWDSLIIPVSKYMDKLTFHLIGKSVLSIWRKNI